MLIGIIRRPFRFGASRINDISLACKSLKIHQHQSLVTDPQWFSNCNHVKTIFLNLDTIKDWKAIQLCHTSKVPPDGKPITDGESETYLTNTSDGVTMRIGGGSSPDAGKTIAFMSNQKKNIWFFEDIGDNWTKAILDKMPKVIAIPTTAGTGSETGRASLIVDEETHTKKIIFHPTMLPDLVILDPELTLTLPAHLTAATGMDALAHCLEAYCANGFHPMADGIAIEGIKNIDSKSENGRSSII